MSTGYGRGWAFHLPIAFRQEGEPRVLEVKVEDGVQTVRIKLE